MGEQEAAEAYRRVAIGRAARVEELMAEVAVLRGGIEAMLARMERTRPDTLLVKAAVMTDLRDLLSRHDAARGVAQNPGHSCPGTRFPDGTRCGEYGWHAPDCPARDA
jgi:hypothetical protein